MELDFYIDLIAHIFCQKMLERTMGAILLMTIYPKQGLIRKSFPEIYDK
jgi:hypothetical protein